MPTDTERLDWLATQAGVALVNDDAGRWAISYEGTQNVPDASRAIDIQTTFFITADRWRDDIRTAIDVAMAQHPEEPAMDTTRADIVELLARHLTENRIDDVDGLIDQLVVLFDGSSDRDMARYNQGRRRAITVLKFKPASIDCAAWLAEPRNRPLPAGEHPDAVAGYDAVVDAVTDRN